MNILFRDFLNFGFGLDGELAYSVPTICTPAVIYSFYCYKYCVHSIHFKSIYMNDYRYLNRCSTIDTV